MGTRRESREQIKFSDLFTGTEKKEREDSQTENLKIITNAFQEVTDFVPETVVELICIFSLQLPQGLFISPSKKSGSTMLFKQGGKVSYQTWIAYDSWCKVKSFDSVLSFDPTQCDVTGTFEVDLERTTCRELRIKATFIHLEMSDIARLFCDWWKDDIDDQNSSYPKTFHLMDISIPQSGGEAISNIYYQWEENKGSQWSRRRILEQDHKDHPFRGVKHHGICPSKIAEEYWEFWQEYPVPFRYLPEVKTTLNRNRTIVSCGDDDLESDLYEITWNSRPLGINIVPSSDKKNTYVNSIDHFSNISKDLKIPSQIMCVNGVSMEAKDHEDILEEMKIAKLPMTVRFKPCEFVERSQSPSLSPRSQSPSVSPENQVDMSYPPTFGSVSNLWSIDSDENEEEVARPTSNVPSEGSVLSTRDLPKWARFLVEV